MTITLTLYLKNDTIESELQEEVRNRLLSQFFSFKVIKAVMFNIDNHENKILAVGYEDKKNQTKDKWNQLNLMDIQSLLGNNLCLVLSHMVKSYIWLEETNQRINEFSIGYMMNQNLSVNKGFKEQVKICLKDTFSTTTPITYQ